MLLRCVTATLIAFGTPFAAVAQDSGGASQCVRLLDQFRPYALREKPDMEFEQTWTNIRQLSEPVDLDRDGRPEEVYLMTGNAVRSYRPAWDFLVLIQPGATNISDGTFASDNQLKQIAGPEKRPVGFVRARGLTRLDAFFKLEGPGAASLPKTNMVLAEIGELGGQPGLKLRVEPYLPGRDPLTGKLIGDPNERYEVLARFNGLETLEVMCVWKMTSEQR